jgi:hypothetical protein
LGPMCHLKHMGSKINKILLHHKWWEQFHVFIQTNCMPHAFLPAILCAETTPSSFFAVER